ncbi:GNAT family N-acetyltransferase [Petrocella sp. FN5]|uniref:GNAT family N-acetyltransferase n=1 Tax=Petrocella sp. FN5 TaxID=3032002 RepID=UPI0023DB434F|nr:GNAT family N-acetyltransferase [Petrocella sp. FN5]MDF1616960.1 GNAT family N-acetyltransferase [Petrocella sp. FN5]
MRSKNYECKPLQWDTDYFGVSSARVNLSGIVDDVGQEEIIDFCTGYDFVTISNLDNIKENNNWIGNRTNAFLADMNIQFLKVLAEKPDDHDEKTYVVNNLSRNEKIVDIARKSYKYSRFFNDPKLPQEQAKNIYLHWTECAFCQENKYFVISEREGNVAGYILFTINENSSIIELIAVDENYQGQRVGKSLIHSMESFAIDQGIKDIKVGTQVNNISAAQFYNAMDFKYVSCGSMYHLWRR